MKSWSQERDDKKASSPVDDEELLKGSSLTPEPVEVSDKILDEEEGEILDPVMEARKRKFESSVPIGPTNKKIKLSKKEESKNDSEEDKPKSEKTHRKKKEKKVVYEEKEDEILLDASFDIDVDNEVVQEEFEDEPELEEAEIEVRTEVKKDEASHGSGKKKSKKKKKDKEVYHVAKFKDLPLSERIGKEKKLDDTVFTNIEDLAKNKEGDVRAWLSKKRAERLNNTRTTASVPARLLQSAFKGVVKE